MNISSLNPFLIAQDERSSPLGGRVGGPPVSAFNHPESGRAPGIHQLAEAALHNAPLSASAQSASVSYHQQQEVELELTTRDGDRVRLRLFSAAGGALEVAGQQLQSEGYSETSLSLEARQSSRSSLQFSVDGDLDADEMAAINDLMVQVNRVADEFFNGDPLKSFEELQELGFDSAEIAGFSLELERRTELQVAYSEAALQQYRDAAGDKGVRPGLGLGRYIAELGEALTRAEVLDDAPRQLGQLLAEVIRPQLESQRDAEDEGEGAADALSELARVQLMNAQLLDALPDAADRSDAET